MKQTNRHKSQVKNKPDGIHFNDNKEENKKYRKILKDFKEPNYFFDVFYDDSKKPFATAGIRSKKDFKKAQNSWVQNNKNRIVTFSELRKTQINHGK
jgi:hypothetical protein